jgi:hypothetical protein
MTRQKYGYVDDDNQGEKNKVDDNCDEMKSKTKSMAISRVHDVRKRTKSAH